MSLRCNCTALPDLTMRATHINQRDVGLFVLLLALATLLFGSLANAAIVSPDAITRWSTVTLRFAGPNTSEDDAENPFANYRLDVKFTHKASGSVFFIPGYYAADGNAAQTGATSGNVWITRFTPPRTGTWIYEASFLTGPNVAMPPTPTGTPTSFHGDSGKLLVSESTATAPDLRAKGRLQYVGQRYLRFANGDYKLKLGTNTPENFLGYNQFDGFQETPNSYDRHENDWSTGDPAWRDGAGKSIIGAINYLSAKGVNSIFSILVTVKGDSQGDVHPWITTATRERFDISKLEQWQIVFGHASKKGMTLNLAFLETENEAIFEDEAGVSKSTGFAPNRKLFYREMIARFSHNIGFAVTLGEENGWSEEDIHGGGNPWGVGNTDAQRRMFTTYLRSLDAYSSPIYVHTFPSLKEEIYAPMLGPASGGRMEGATLQMAVKETTHAETLEWISRSTKRGQPWVVTADEFGDGGVPVASSGALDMSFRAQFCWGNVLAGGGGVEVFSAYVDQGLDDFRVFESAWSEFSRPMALFETHNIPFYAMTNRDDLVTTARTHSNAWLYALAAPGDSYVIYESGNLEPQLDLSEYSGSFFVRWFNPRKEESTDLATGSLSTVKGGSKVGLGKPPSDVGKDWVVVVARSIPFSTRAAALVTASSRDLIPNSLTLGQSSSQYVRRR